MVKFLSRTALKIFGWKIEGVFPEGKKFVVIAAPHTSSWDFVLGRLYYNSIGKSVRFMINEKFFFFPLGIWFKALGGIPVKAGRRVGLVKQMVGEFREREEFLLTITPEGTRKRVKKWMRGFYFIAKDANVPIVLGFIDFKEKALGTKTTIYLTDDVDADIERIRKIYQNVSASHPDKFNSEKI